MASADETIAPPVRESPLVPSCAPEKVDVADELKAEAERPPANVLVAVEVAFTAPAAKVPIEDEAIYEFEA